MQLSENLLTTTQQAAIDRLYSYDRTILIAPTGAGKTVICLTAIAELTAAGERTAPVIVACPAKVVPVWAKEAARWPHTRDMVVRALTGLPEKRAVDLKNPADIYVISLNNLDWLLQQNHGCDGIIVDELSKASGKQARKLTTKTWGDCFTWRVGMTATPVSQNFEKLFAMVKLVDGGRALGRSKEKYLNEYFDSDYMGYNLTLKGFADATIISKIKCLIHAVEDTKAADLPPVTYKTIRFEMPGETRAVYNEMKKDMVAGDVEAANSAVQSGKLRQIASGFLYGDDGLRYLEGVRACVACFEWWVKATESGVKKGIIFYEYVEQAAAIHKMFDGEATSLIEEWEGTEANILVAQINSLSHGIDGLQNVCSDVLFYHPMWSRDAMEQAVGRVWRTGQTKPVTVTTLVCENTLDDLVMERVEDRGVWMDKFMKHLKG